MSKRRSYSPQFKAEVVLEALKGEKSAAQICRERGISHDLLTRWRQQFLEQAPQLFTNGRSISREQVRIAELERLVGQLTMELELSKKISTLLTSRHSKSGSW
jgi:transposase-like protein